MKYTIYKTTNLINGKIYIGKHQTTDPNDDYLGSGKHLTRAIQKYGRDNFVKEVLHIFETEEEMNAKEAELVTADFVKENTNYNMCPGGQGGWGYINSNYSILRVDSQRIVNKIRRQKLQHKMDHDASFNAKVRKSLSIASIRAHEKRSKSSYKIDQFFSEHANLKRIETFNNISHQQGSSNSQYGTMWITNGSENKKIKKFDIIPEGWYKGRKIKS